MYLLYYFYSKLKNRRSVMSVVKKINDHFKEILTKGEPVNEMKILP